MTCLLTLIAHLCDVTQLCLDGKLGSIYPNTTWFSFCSELIASLLTPCRATALRHCCAIARVYILIWYPVSLPAAFHALFDADKLSCNAIMLNIIHKKIQSKQNYLWTCYIGFVLTFSSHRKEKKSKVSDLNLSIPRDALNSGSLLEEKNKNKTQGKREKVSAMVAGLDMLDLF